MNYQGRIYGRVGKKYFELGTTHDLDRNQQIQRLESKYIGMQEAQKLITEFDNSAIDHFERELNMLFNRIQKLKLGVTKTDQI